MNLCCVHTIPGVCDLCRVHTLLVVRICCVHASGVNLCALCVYSAVRMYCSEIYVRTAGASVQTLIHVSMLCGRGNPPSLLCRQAVNW